jgi:hypothetical protein
MVSVLSDMASIWVLSGSNVQVDKGDIASQMFCNLEALLANCDPLLSMPVQEVEPPYAAPSPHETCAINEKFLD